MATAGATRVPALRAETGGSSMNRTAGMRRRARGVPRIPDAARRGGMPGAKRDRVDPARSNRVRVWAPGFFSGAVARGERRDRALRDRFDRTSGPPSEGRRVRPWAAPVTKEREGSPSRTMEKCARRGHRRATDPTGSGQGRTARPPIGCHRCSDRRPSRRAVCGPSLAWRRRIGDHVMTYERALLFLLISARGQHHG
jgi:hypothetical protein